MCKTKEVLSKAALAQQEVHNQNHTSTAGSLRAVFQIPQEHLTSRTPHQPSPRNLCFRAYHSFLEFDISMSIHSVEASFLAKPSIVTESQWQISSAPGNSVMRNSCKSACCTKLAVHECLHSCLLYFSISHPCDSCFPAQAIRNSAVGPIYGCMKGDLGPKSRCWSSARYSKKFLMGP